MKHLLVRGPHSHRARARFARAFVDAGIECKPVRIALGMNGTGAIIPDTVEALTLARTYGASKSSIQWAHLSQDDTEES